MFELLLVRVAFSFRFLVPSVPLLALADDFDGFLSKFFIAQIELVPLALNKRVFLVMLSYEVFDPSNQGLWHRQRFDNVVAGNRGSLELQTVKRLRF